jgi:hypothetical protein
MSELGHQAFAFVHERCAEAAQARHQAEGDLAACLLYNHTPRKVAQAMAQVARTRAVAHWWRDADRALKPVRQDHAATLTWLRLQALHVLTDQATPHAVCPFAQGVAVAEVEAARVFYHATEHLTEPAQGTGCDPARWEVPCTCGSWA